MELKELDKQISEYLNLAELDFDKGVDLYKQHPSARLNVVQSLKVRRNKPPMALKLIYELEKLIGETTHSNRKAIINNDLDKSVFMPDIDITEIEDETLFEDFSYKIDYKDLPKRLQSKVIRKGQLYDELNIYKKQLSELGDKNADDVKQQRADILNSMKKTVKYIKRIHEILQISENEISGKGMKTQIEVDTELDKHFNYSPMSYFQLKDLKKRLESLIHKQQRQAKEAKKENTRKTNAEKAKKTQRMLNILADYFAKNK